MSDHASLERAYAFYHDLTHHYVPGPQSLSYFLAPLFLFLALLVPQSTLSSKTLAALFLPVIYGSAIHAWYVIGAVEVMSVTVVLWATALLGCRDGRTFVRVKWARNPGGQVEEINGFTDIKAKSLEVAEHSGPITEEAHPETLRARIPWVCALLVSLRLTGWRVGDGKHDAAQPAKQLSRSAFARHALAFVLFDFLILDATFLYVRHDPYFTTSDMGIDEPFQNTHRATPTFIACMQMLPPRLLRCAILAAQVFAMVSGMFYLPTLPASLLNGIGLLPDEWSPHAWPVFFGNFLSIWDRGLRGLWGGWWHQINREFVSSPGKALMEALGLPKRSLVSYALLITTSFLFSGILHMGLIPPEPLVGSMSTSGMRLHVAAFFWVQIPGIVFETMVEGAVRRCMPDDRHRLSTKTIALLWTVAWLCLVLPMLTIPFRDIGYWTTSPVGKGILQPVIDFCGR